MRNNIIFLVTTLILTALLAGCPSGGEQPKANANQPNVNAPKSNANTGAITTTTRTPEPVTNQADTIGPVFKAYCDAMTRGDEAAVRKLLAAETLKTHLADMKEEKETSLVKYLAADGISNKVCEVANENVKGDTAVVLVKTEGAPNGVKYKFVKENGEWKVAGPVFESMQK